MLLLSFLSLHRIEVPHHHTRCRLCAPCTGLVLPFSLSRTVLWFTQSPLKALCLVISQIVFSLLVSLPQGCLADRGRHPGLSDWCSFSFFHSASKPSMSLMTFTLFTDKSKQRVMSRFVKIIISTLVSPDQEKVGGQYQGCENRGESNSLQPEVIRKPRSLGECGLRFYWHHGQHQWWRGRRNKNKMSMNRGAGAGGGELRMRGRKAATHSSCWGWGSSLSIEPAPGLALTGCSLSAAVLLPARLGEGWRKANMVMWLYWVW